jgi:hypothetical protein
MSGGIDAYSYAISINVPLVIYLAGVLIGLWRTDARWPSRLLIAALWPIGPLAFVVTIAVLLAATPIAFIGPRPRSG